jgi:hypothetical protein
MVGLPKRANWRRIVFLDTSDGGVNPLKVISDAESGHELRSALHDRALAGLAGEILEVCKDTP